MKSAIRNAFKWGFITGLVVILYVALSEIIPFSSEWLPKLIGYISIIILPLGIYLGIKHLVIINRFSFWGAIGTGLLIAVISAIMVMCYRYGKDKLLTDSETLWFQKNHQMIEQQGSHEGAGVLDLNQSHNFSLSKYLTTLWSYLILGTIYTWICYFLFTYKLKKNETIIS